MPAKKQTGTASKEQIAKTYGSPAPPQELIELRWVQFSRLSTRWSTMVIESQLQSDRCLSPSSILPELRPRRSRSRQPAS
jgi:hypothetical protein